MDQQTRERAIEQLSAANEMLREHEAQLARVRNVIQAALETTNFTKERARGVLRDIADILNIALEV